MLIATGLYLLLFYRIGSPYASMTRITEQVWLGRWIRTMHRYAADAARRLAREARGTPFALSDAFGAWRVIARVFMAHSGAAASGDASGTGYFSTRTGAWDLVILVNPNSPTGRHIPKPELEALLRDADRPEAVPTKPARTHWDMLLERRSTDELEEILAQRVEFYREKHAI